MGTKKIMLFNIVARRGYSFKVHYLGYPRYNFVDPLFALGSNEMIFDQFAFQIV